MAHRWQPAGLVRVDSIAITAILLTAATVRSFDYLTGREAARQATGLSALSEIERVAPLWMWGAAVGVGALVLASGLVTRWHRLVWSGNVLLGALYSGLAIGLGLEYLGNPWLDGMRTAVLTAVPAVLHLLLAMRTGWTPLQLEDGRTSEVQVTDGGSTP